MNWLQKLQLRFGALFQKQKLDEQMDAKILAAIGIYSIVKSRNGAESLLEGEDE